MDDKSIRSFNGYRVAKYLQANIKNYSNFQMTLKLIKLWAKNRGKKKKKKKKKINFFLII